MASIRDIRSRNSRSFSKLLDDNATLYDLCVVKLLEVVDMIELEHSGRGASTSIFRAYINVLIVASMKPR